MKDSHITILVVDDDDSFRKVITKILTAKGYRVVEVPMSIPVIHSIIKEKPDLILLDLYMPRAGGIEIIKTMKRMDIDIPVVIISGLLSNLDFQILHEKGVKHFLAKPVSLRILLAKVKEVLYSRVVSL
ncbi:MAG: response regulator [Candidatus Latescibacteria bacterium]|jgi:CheY-like chemotaxis protein|nr:response regulator [Candidatus Latescibacterota bacterium]